MDSLSKLSITGALLLLHGVVGAADLAGRYTVMATPDTWLLELVSDGHSYTGSLAADSVVVGTITALGTEDEDGDYSVEGFINGQINAEFSFYADDDDGSHRLLMIHLVGDAADYGRAAEYRARPETAAVPDESPTPRIESLGDYRNPHLVGLWSAQVSNAGSDGSFAVELYMEFRNDGYLVDRGSRAMASVDGAGLDGGIVATGDAVLWRSNGATIYVSADAAQWAPLARYEISGQRLLLTYYDGSRQLWYRR